MDHNAASDPPTTGQTPDPATTGDPLPPAAVTDESQVEPRDPTGGPTTLGWWLDDGPDSPIAADIEEPEKHL